MNLNLFEENTTLTFEITISDIKTHDRWDATYYDMINKVQKNNIHIKTIDELKKFTTNGSTPYGPAYTNNGVKFFRANDIKVCQIDRHGHKYISKIDSDKQKRAILNVNDLLITIKGKIGITSIVTADLQDSNINQDVALVRLKDENSNFVQMMLNSNFVQTQIKRYATETVNPFLGLSNLDKIKIPIIDELKSKIIQASVQSNNENIRSLTIMKKIHELFEQFLGFEIDSISEKSFFTLNNSQLNYRYWTPTYYYPKYNYIIRKLKKFETITITNNAICNGDEPGRENYIPFLKKIDSNIPFTRTSDLINYEVDDYPDFFLNDELADKLNQDLQAKDILITTEGKIGMCALIISKEKMVIQSHVTRLRINDKKLQLYIFAFLTTHFAKCQINKYIVYQSTIPTIHDNITNIIIPILPDEQRDKIITLMDDFYIAKEKSKKLRNETIKMIDKHLK